MRVFFTFEFGGVCIFTVAGVNRLMVQYVCLLYIKFVCVSMRIHVYAAPACIIYIVGLCTYLQHV